MENKKQHGLKPILQFYKAGYGEILMYEMERLVIIVSCAALLCIGCNNDSNIPMRTTVEPGTFRTADLATYYPQINEPRKYVRPNYEEDINKVGPVEYLKTASWFRIGKVGFAAETPPEYIALHMITAKNDGSALLRKLFDEGTIVGKLYALTGFYYIDRSTFNELASGLRDDSRSVTRHSGCEIFTQTVKEVIKAIEAGNFDRDMKKSN